MTKPLSLVAAALALVFNPPLWASDAHAPAADHAAPAAGHAAPAAGHAAPAADHAAPAADHAAPAAGHAAPAADHAAPAADHAAPAAKSSAAKGGHGSAPHWTYSGAMGPEHWGELDPKFTICSSGKNQTPVDMTNFIEGELPALKLSYTDGGNEVLNNGHTIQVNYQRGNTLEVDGRKFELKQFHFHSPSENWIEGSSFPMEVHLVHADKESNLAVIGVMFKEGAANPELDKIWAKMPHAADEKVALEEFISATAILPKNRDYYRFNGSLTTPPCSEGVRWLVMKDPITASKAQINSFLEVMGHANNRPIQPVNARVILK